MKSPWPTKKLGEICEENKKSPFKVENADNLGDYPFFTSGGNILKHSEFLVDGENIFLSTGGYAHVKYYDDKASYSADTWSLKVKDALTKYIYYQILEKIKFIDLSLFRGTGLRHLQKKEFLKLEIPLPPLLIQQKIVSILDTIQSAIEIQEKIIEKTKELKKSLLNEIFNSKVKIKKSKLKFRINKYVILKELIEKIEYGISKKGAISGNFPILRMNNLKNGKINLEDLQYVNLSDNEFNKFKLEKGDIIFNRTNSLELVGKTAIFNLRGSYVFASYLLRIKVKKELIIPEFLNFYFNWEEIQKNLKCLASRGASQVNISATRLENFKIPLFSIPDQCEIVDILQTIDQKIEIEQKKKALYEELFRTMLNKIVTQEIDVEKINL